VELTESEASASLEAIRRLGTEDVAPPGAAWIREPGALGRLEEEVREVLGVG